MVIRETSYTTSTTSATNVPMRTFRYLVGIRPWSSRVVLVPGMFAGHPLELDEEEYLDGGKDEDYDHIDARKELDRDEEKID